MNDSDILGTLQGMIYYAREMLALPAEPQKTRTKVAVDRCIVWMHRQAVTLPEVVVQRIDTLDMHALRKGDETIIKQPAIDNLHNPELLQQLIRAANVYRDRLGYAPLGADGWPRSSGVFDNE